jgi:hypothetical protein
MSSHGQRRSAFFIRTCGRLFIIEVPEDIKKGEPKKRKALHARSSKRGNR